MPVTNSRKPDFTQLIKVLRREAPDRPTLFEFYLNGPLYERLAGRPQPAAPGAVARRQPVDSASADERTEILAYYRELGRWYADAFRAGGYDYVNFAPGVAFPRFRFREGGHEKAKSHSLNEGSFIASRDDLERFSWPTAGEIDLAIIDSLVSSVPDGMGALAFTPGGVLENLVDVMGYDNLCFALVDDRELVAAVAQRIGSALVTIYEAIAPHPRIGALIANDDWGFKTQTMISPADLREFVFPYHRRMAEIAHAAGKPILLHSCGQLVEVMDDVIDTMRFDAKHSFEDVILPVEDVYERWGDRIAILGGIDVDMLCSASEDAITARSRAMIERTADRGGYALGSGNSIPEYVPQEAYFAMTRAALE